jgi:hypothetical protein
VLPHWRRIAVVSESVGRQRVPRRIDAGEVLAAVGGALAFVALFLDWFDRFSGWEAFEALDLAIAVLALVAVASAVASIAGSSAGPSPRALPWVGTVLLAVVAVQLIEPPPTLIALEGDPDRETGAWLALGGSALVLLGGVLRAARISVTISVGARGARRRGPAVARRPAAPVGTAPEGGPPGAAGEAARHSGDDQPTQAFSPAADR